ncbi:hypothetical protein N0A02_31860 [Paraburkholderia acidicola]|uniref:Uncharacterized protein n=1 Tax=Paraburkholderia acidicola TaxID=1912599 RepID=A0ABV1LXP8_9BURK
MTFVHQIRRNARRRFFSRQAGVIENNVTERPRLISLRIHLDDTFALLAPQHACTPITVDFPRLIEPLI